MEDAALARRLRQQDDGACHLVDGRELHWLVAHLEGIAAQHLEHAYAAHGGIGLEVDLELAIGRARREIAHTHHLGIEPVDGDGLENHPVGDELRVYVLVVEILPEVESLLGEGLGGVGLAVDGEASRAVG